jgi:pimeloyl-ACP methyl ester carboxylesterase
MATFKTRDDVKKFNRRILVIHGDDDQIAPIDLSARVMERMLPSAETKIYEGAHTGWASPMQAASTRICSAF